MAKKKKPVSATPRPPTGANALRARAEAQLQAASAALAGRSLRELKPLLHELQVHQVELEMQNEELRRTQVELAHARDEFADLYDYAPVGYLSLNPEGVIHRANRTAARLLGVERERLIGTTIFRYAARSSQDALFLHSRALTSAESTRVVEIDLRPGPAGKGGAVELQSCLRPGGSAGKHVWRIVLVDVNARRKAEAEWKQLNAELERRVIERTAALDRSVVAARESEARLAEILDTAMDAIVSVDERQRIVLVNPAAERMFGHPAGSLIGRPLDVLIPAAQRRAHRAYVHAFESGDTAHRLVDPVRPVTGLRADGTEFPIEASIARSSINGRVVSTAILRDVSLRRLAEVALLQNEKALTDFFVEAPIGLLWVDPDGRIERINRAQLVMMDRVNEEIVGRPIAEFHAHPEVIAHLLERVRRHETVTNVRIQIERRDRSLCHALVSANGVWDEGRLIRSRWFVRDITERIDLEREILAIAERERERIGHELHDGLCQELLSLEFRCEALARKLEAVSPVDAGHAREIAAGVRNTMEQGRELARGLSPPSVVAGQGLVESLAALAERTRRVFQRECTFRAEAVRPIVDPAIGTHLYRIAQEAVGNAIRHGSATRIEIRLTTRDDDLVLGIEDNGQGIPDPLPKGRGLGLRIMQYRAGTINGSVVVQRCATGGTAVVCTVKHAFVEPSSPR